MTASKGHGNRRRVIRRGVKPRIAEGKAAEIETINRDKQPEFTSVDAFLAYLDSVAKPEEPLVKPRRKPR